MQQKENATEATSVSKLRQQEVSLGLILRVPIALAEDIESRIENYFSGKLVYVRWSAGKLYISDKHPKDESP